MDRLAKSSIAGLHARMLTIVLACYAAASLITFVLYGWDKRAARRAAPRVRERTLHLWALAGGALGAFAGQLWFRHKTRHASFAVVAGFAVAVHVAGWAWWFAR